MALKKTVIQVTVLHEDFDDAAALPLGDLAEQMDTGGMLGKALHISTVHVAPGTEVVEMMRVGNDGSFFEVGDQREDVTVATLESEEERFGKVGWSASDALTLAPKLTLEQARNWLDSNSKHITDRLTELGWGVMETLMRSDGVDMSSDDDESEDEAAAPAQPLG